MKRRAASCSDCQACPRAACVWMFSFFSIASAPVMAIALSTVFARGSLEHFT